MVTAANGMELNHKKLLHSLLLSLLVFDLLQYPLASLFVLLLFYLDLVYARGKERDDDVSFVNLFLLWPKSRMTQVWPTEHVRYAAATATHWLCFGQLAKRIQTKWPQPKLSSEADKLYVTS